MADEQARSRRHHLVSHGHRVSHCRRAVVLSAAAGDRSPLAPALATLAIPVIISSGRVTALHLRRFWGRCMQQKLWEQVQRQAQAADGSPIWKWFGLTVTVGVAYFLAARLSLLQLTETGVAIFWPAAGISSGIL